MTIIPSFATVTAIVRPRHSVEPDGILSICSSSRVRFSTEKTGYCQTFYENREEQLKPQVRIEGEETLVGGELRVTISVPREKSVEKGKLAPTRKPVEEKEKTQEFELQ